MPRFLLLLLMWVATLGGPVLAQTTADGLPPRPKPFRFVNDEAQVLAPAEAKKLESGLRRYADNTGTQVVVVTVPSLGGREVADYARALGTAWGVGQRGKNNGVVVLVAPQDRKVSIQPGSGLADRVTPAVVQRVIGQQFGPNFKQGQYFAGLRAGLNELLLAANPNSAPKQRQPVGTLAQPATAAETPGDNLAAAATTPPAGVAEPVTPVAPAPSGPGLGSLLLWALLIGGGLFLVFRLLRRRSAAPAANAPDFYPTRPNSPAANYPPAGPAGYGYNGGPYNGPAAGNTGSGLGGILATGAAAAAGAYLGNRMAQGASHDGNAQNLAGDNSAANFGAGAAGLGAGTAGTGAAADYFATRDGGDNAAPDYFADDATSADASNDYFSDDSGSSSYDDSSGDTGGGGFDNNDSGGSGSW